MKILNSKLQAPKLLNVLYRERLVRLFNALDQKKLITVTAGAGYGKTTLVIDALSRMDVNTVWYRLDQQDTDFMVFLTYLNFGILQNHPEDENKFKKSLITKNALKNRNDLLLEFIKTLENDFYKETAFVLDDYHLVQDSREINAAVEFILERLPQHIHLIIISRKEPPIKISKIRVAEQLLEIREKDLSFTSTEIKEFYSTVYRLSATTDQIDDLHEKTGGWAASLVLFSYALKDKTPEEIKKNLGRFKGSQHHIFSYLEENVFETQPPEIQDFMLKISLLSMIDAKACNRIFQINTAQKMLGQMIKDHLLIFPFNESSSLFYLHHLFQDFLVAKLHQRHSLQQINQLHRQIAVEIEKEDIFQALHHYIEGQNFDAVVRLIQANEMKFLIEGKIHFLGKCLEKIPKTIIEQNPQLLFAEAKLYSYFGNPRDAILKLKAAYKLFKKTQSNEDMVKCLIDIGSQYYCTGHVKEAKLLMEQVLDDVEKTSATYIIAMTYLIFLAAVLGEFDKAKKYTQQARNVISEYPDFERQAATALINTSYTYYYYILGEFYPSHQLNKKLLNISLDLKIEPILPLVYYQCAATSNGLEQFEKGVEYAQKGIDICEKIELKDSKKGWVYIAFAQNCLGLGRLEQAIDLLEQSIEIFETPGNRWGLANAWDCLAHVYLEQGKIDQAKQLLTKAFDIIDNYGLTITEGILGNSMADVHVRENNFISALDCLNRARPKIKDASFYLFENHMRTARCYHDLKNQKQAIFHLVKGLKISKEKEYARFVEKEKKWISLLLDSRELTQTQSILVQPFLESIKDAAPPVLTLYLFGSFRLFAGKRQIPSFQFKSSKALMILKYLAANSGAGFIQREVIIEMLWPDEDLEKTGKRFNVAMSALRKVLEPDIAPKAASAYILRKKDAYRLCRDNDTRIDVERFLDQFHAGKKLEAKSPQKALTHYLAAESFYQGPFLEEDPYEEWCIRKRDFLDSTYIQVLISILRFYEATKDLKNCITYAEKILKKDPYDEETVRKLMGFYALKKNPAIVKKTYEAYKKSAKEMDFPVSPETRALLKNLIQHQQNA